MLDHTVSYTIRSLSPGASKSIVSSTTTKTGSSTLIRRYLVLYLQVCTPDRVWRIPFLLQLFIFSNLFKCPPSLQGDQTWTSRLDWGSSMTAALWSPWWHWATPAPVKPNKLSQNHVNRKFFRRRLPTFFQHLIKPVGDSLLLLTRDIQ